MTEYLRAIGDTFREVGDALNTDKEDYYPIQTKPATALEKVPRILYAVPHQSPTLTLITKNYIKSLYSLSDSYLPSPGNPVKHAKINIRSTKAPSENLAPIPSHQSGLHTNRYQPTQNSRIERRKEKQRNNIEREREREALHEHPKKYR